MFRSRSERLKRLSNQERHGGVGIRIVAQLAAICLQLTSRKIVIICLRRVFLRETRAIARRVR